jgi:hypothetical protein
MKPLEQEEIKSNMLQYEFKQNNGDRDHSKNGASLKSKMSRGNFLKMTVLFCVMFCSSIGAWAQEESFFIQGITDIKDKGKYAVVMSLKLNENSLTISMGKVGENGRDYYIETTIKKVTAKEINNKKMVYIHLNEEKFNFININSTQFFYGTEEGQGFLIKDLRTLFDDFDFDSLYKAAEKRTK